MATLTHDQAPVHDDRHDALRRVRAIVAGSSGNLVEWYDFYVYSFTALYFASELFPAGDQTTQLLNAAGVFGAGFLMRPVGSWLFGKIADTRGRRGSCRARGVEVSSNQRSVLPRRRADSGDSTIPRG